MPCRLTIKSLLKPSPGPAIGVRLEYPTIIGVLLEYPTGWEYVSMSRAPSWLDYPGWTRCRFIYSDGSVSKPHTRWD